MPCTMFHELSGDGAHPRRRVGRGENAVLGNSLPSFGGEGILWSSCEKGSAMPAVGLHLVVVEEVLLIAYQYVHLIINSYV